MSELMNVFAQDKYTYAILDTSEIYKKYYRLATLFSVEGYHEIFRQIFEKMTPNLTELTAGLSTLPNLTLFRYYSDNITQDFRVQIKDQIFALGFEIYMEAKYSGLFIGEHGEKSFPFLLQRISPGCCYLLIDKYLIKQAQSQKSQYEQF